MDASRSPLHFPECLPKIEGWPSQEEFQGELLAFLSVSALLENDIEELIAGIELVNRRFSEDRLEGSWQPWSIMLLPRMCRL